MNLVLCLLHIKYNGYGVEFGLHIIKIRWIVFLDVRTSYGVLESETKKEIERPLLGNIIKESNNSGKFYIGR